MSRPKDIEDQAIMNLIFLGQDDQPPQIINTFARYQSKVLEEGRHKFKSNTFHLRNMKNALSYTQAVTPNKLNSQERKSQHSKNKENLKKILEKLENSPSPKRKTIEKNHRTVLSRVKTQKSQPIANSKSRGRQNKTPKLAKKDIDKLFNKKKDQEFIKSLIKAKIVEKLKKIESKKTDKKTVVLVNLLDSRRQPLSKKLQKQRMVTLRSDQLSEKTKYTNLIRQQHFINTSLISRKNSHINLKQLLF